jgi:hypothetical protein
MPDSNVQKMAHPPTGRRAPHIALLGPPKAGKSSLVRALIESASVPGQALPGHFVEREADLTDPRKQLHDPEIQRADALLFAVDATDDGQFEETLASFTPFLSLLEQARGNRMAVGGWPVFVVLTKCDLLAQPGDDQAAWKRRMDHVQRRAEEPFHQFLGRQRAGPLPFGSVELHVRTVAIKQPDFGPALAKAGHPFGIDKLFQQLFSSASAYRQRRARSTRRLAGTMSATLLLVAGVIGLAGFLLTQRRLEDPAVQELLDKVESYRAREPATVSNRLREPLQPHLSELADLEHDPNFPRLPADKREYVRQRQQELTDYRAYEDSLLQLPSLSSLRTEQELQALESRLKELAVPAGTQSDWSQTEAALLRSQRLKEAGALRTGIAEMEHWYANLQEHGQALAAFSGPAGAADWRGRLSLLVQQAARPPHRDRDPLRGTRLTYESVFRFAEVVQARSAWEDLRRRLEELARLTEALGLGVSDPAGSPLALPTEFRIEQAAPVLAELERLYPRYSEEFRLANLPEAAVPEIRKAARDRYAIAVAAGREAVLRHLKAGSPGGPDTPEAWRRLLPWLSDPAELKAWRVLALLLARLVDPAAADPVASLEAFLRRDQFDITLQRLYLEVPESRNFEPSGKLAIEHSSGGVTSASVSFEVLGDFDHDARRRLRRYTFRPPSAARFAYKPGETLTAELPVSLGGSGDYLLTWSSNRSQSFQFERLLRPPRLHPKDQTGSSGEAAEGVRLVISPGDGVPAVPDLLPDVSESR